MIFNHENHENHEISSVANPIFQLFNISCNIKPIFVSPDNQHCRRGEFDKREHAEVRGALRRHRRRGEDVVRFVVRNGNAAPSVRDGVVTYHAEQVEFRDGGFVVAENNIHGGECRCCHIPNGFDGMQWKTRRRNVGMIGGEQGRNNSTGLTPAYFQAQTVGEIG